MLLELRDVDKEAPSDIVLADYDKLAADLLPAGGEVFEFVVVNTHIMIIGREVQITGL